MALDLGGIKKLLERLVREIWKTRAIPRQIDESLVEFFASTFWQAVEEGYGQSLEEVDFDTPDYEMLRKLELGVYQFSMAKSYQHLKSISQALLDENGKLRSFNLFRQAAAEINNAFINQWLQAEYQFAVASAQSASQWQQIQATKDVLPLLRYLTAGDERVRLEHQELEDVVRPADDDFWDIYYPPNGWGCRCDVVQQDTGSITPLEKISLPDVPPIFRYNAGKRGIPFPPGHPYYDGLPENLKSEAVDIWIKNRIDRNGDIQ